MGMLRVLRVARVCLCVLGRRKMAVWHADVERILSIDDLGWVVQVW